MNRKRIFMPLLAFIMAFITHVNLPYIVFAQNDTTEQPVPSIFIDNECVSLDDARILNVVSVPPSRVRSTRPNATKVLGLSGEWSYDPDVSMDGHKVSAKRYVVTVDNIEYEAYCANPNLKGPDNDGAVYELTGEANAQLRNVLKNGYPINCEWSWVTEDLDERAYYVYITRVAVAMANNPSHSFTGDQDIINQAKSLADGSTTANADAYPPIMVNGAKDAQDTGRIIKDTEAQSESFEVTHNRKTNLFYNPFKFEWAEGTPDGAKLIVDGNVIATAPDNPDTVFKDDITSFQIEMPNTAEYEGKTAAVNLVGVHNQFADTYWMMQNPNDPDGWQDIVFYIPEVTASAMFSFEKEAIEPEEAELKIIKRNSSGNGLAGAVFEITGPDGYKKQETTPSNGTIRLKGLTPGDYTVTEITPPSGHKIAEPASATVAIAPNSTEVIEKVFINDPENEPEANKSSVKIQKIDALTRENIPGALIRLRGISSSQVVTEDGQIKEIDNTGINLSQVLTKGAATGGGDVKSTVTDGVWELEGLPYGAYVAEEERAPDNYSLLPQHTSYSFWLLPGNVTIKLNQDESTVYVDNVQVSVHEALNAAIAGIQNYNDAEGLATELQGILDTLLSQLQVDAVFTIEVDQSTNSQLITFENYPFGKIEVTKYDMVTESPLGGAHFRIQGYFAEGSTNGMPIDRVGITGADGKLIFDNLPAGQYTISEIEAPDGYELAKPNFQSVSLTWGQTNSVAFYNKPKTHLEVIKVDGDTNEKLAGAIFRLTDPTSGEFWEGETGADGSILLGAGDGSRGNQLESETTYILTEIQAPPGYVLDPAPREVVLGANNIPNSLTFANYRKPTLTIIKYDELTNEPLAGATFRLWRTEGETWSENQITDVNGKIVWTDLDSGIYSLQEIDEPYGYFKDPDRKEILLNGGDNKELTFFNRPRPILTILKLDKVTGEPLADVLFKVQRLEGETIGEFMTDANGMIELSPRTGYLLEEKIYRVTELTPPDEYLLDTVNVKDVMLKWYEPTELVFENLLKPTLIFIKRNGLTGRGIDNATYNVEYESGNGGITNLGTYKTKCGLIVIPYVQPGWYILTETIPAPGYALPTNPVQRMYLAPGANSYTYEQTQTDLYVDDRTNPMNGTKGMCGDWCGYLCSQLCAGNCGNPGGGNMSGSTGGSFGNLTITNGNGDPLGNGTTTPTNPGKDPKKPVLSAGTVTRNSDLTAAVQFTSSAAGKYYYSVVNSGANEPIVATGGVGAVCSSGSNTVTIYMTAGVKDVYIKVKDADGNVSDALKITVPAYSSSQPLTEEPPSFDGIVITGGTVVYLNPDFSSIKITFGN